MNPHHVWTSKDGNTQFLWAKVDGYRYWPQGVSSTGSPYARRLYIYLNGAEMLVSDEDVDDLLVLLRAHFETL